MRPLKLTISAFGPYADKQVIDFSELKNKNIFLITGPTGAGKTTIFDAISFVLFGEASGSSRESDSLRSQFASIDTQTYVEMVFELREEKYTIRRNPKYERKKARGEGLTIQESDAELILPDGSIVTKVSSVDEKISSILGINKNQFRQIVMLPQGEFRKLLEADSKEREVIFRKIFGTEAFQAIQMKLLSLQKSYESRIKENDTKRKTHVKHIETGEDELLTRLVSAEYLNIDEIQNRTKVVIKKDKEENKKLNEAKSSIKKEQERLQKEIVEGSEINKKFKDKEEIEKLFNAELLKENDYIEKKDKLEKARKAFNVKFIEDTLIERKNNLLSKEKAYKEAEKNLASAEESVALWENKLKQEETKEEERNSLSKKAAALKEKEQKVKDYEARCLNIESLRKKLKEKKSLCEKLKGAITIEKADISKLNGENIYIKECETEKIKLKSNMDEKNALCEKLRDLRIKTRQYTNNVTLHNDEGESYNTFEKDFLALKANCEAMEDRFLKGQAGILAMSLENEKPCPVCGSATHPNPAKPFLNAPTEEELKETKKIYNLQNEEKNKRLQRLSALNAKIEEGLRELNDTRENLVDILGESILTMSHDEILIYINENGPKLKNEAEAIEQEINKLELTIKEKTSVESSLKKYEEDLKVKEDKLSKAEEEYTLFYGKVKSEEEQLKTAEEEIPEDIRSTLKLANKIKEVETKLLSLEKAYKEAQKKFNECKNEYAAAKTDKEGRFKAIEEVNKEVGTYKDNLHEKLLEYGFKDYNEYAEFKVSQKQIDSLEKEISEYYKKLQELKGSLEKAKRDVDSLEKVDVEELSKKLSEIKENEKIIEDMEKGIFLRIKNNENSLKEIEKINKEMKKDEEHYGIISDLAKTANGYNNDKITFERYVLAAYFDEIISAANLRLNKMTGGRFILKRKEDRGKYGRQEGLELEVFDNYTGKSRHVKTLSGGESFKASLSLALGLADVVQAYAGGISLDTMFIDEGFGTLDPESLDNAIQCLIDLQKSGRLVGIISHVPELKERIDARLEITPAKEGSRISFAG